MSKLLDNESIFWKVCVGIIIGVLGYALFMVSSAYEATRAAESDMAVRCKSLAGSYSLSSRKCYVNGEEV